MNKLNYMYPFTETFLDYPDDESLGLSVYIMGCDNDCNDCSNPEFADRKYSKSICTDVDTLIDYIREASSKSHTNKIIFTGGDPLYKENIEAIKIITNILYKDFDICIYTGKTIEYVIENKINNFKFLKCSKYISDFKQISEKTDEYIQFASSNQELYDSDFRLLSNDGRYYF